MAYPFQNNFDQLPSPYVPYSHRSHLDNELFFIEDNFDTSPKTPKPHILNTDEEVA